MSKTKQVVINFPDEMAAQAPMVKHSLFGGSLAVVLFCRKDIPVSNVRSLLIEQANSLREVADLIQKQAEESTPDPQVLQ